MDISECIYNYSIHKDRHISISASAGTGKTYTITKIVEQFVDNNINLKNIAIITYTEKAAQELKIRIKKTLVKLTKDNLQLTDQIDEIQIGTIHQFCRNILNNEIFHLSYSYNYEEVRNEDYILKEIFEDFWDKIEIKYEEELYILLRYIPYKDFKERILSIVKTVRNHSIAEIPHQKKERIIDRFKEIFEDYSLNLEKFLVSHPKKNLDRYRLNQQFFDLNDIVDVKKSFDMIYKNSSEDFYKSYLKKSKQIQEEKLKEQLQIFQQEISNFFLSKLAFFSNLFISFYYSYLLEKDQFPTSDLIVETKKILQKKSQIAQTISEKYIYTIIDECQDTNNEQIEIFKLIYEKKKRGIILVGDLKQSIYRFQGADLDSYKKAENIFQTSSLTLNQTRRSGKFLTKGINILTQNIFEPDERISYEEIFSMKESNKYPIKNSPPIQLIECDKSYINNLEEIKEYEKRITQTNGISDWILESVDNKEFQIFDKNEWRNIKFSDIVILTQKNDNPQLKSILIQKNIPFCITDNRKILSEPIIKPILNLLSSIENPYNKLDLFLCLESIIFNINRQDLLKEDISYLSKSSNENLQTIYTNLYWAYKNRYNMQAGNILYKVLKDTESIDYLSLGVYGSQNIKYIEKFIEYLNIEQIKNSFSFGELITSLKTDIKNGKEIKINNILEKNEIQIMTYHKSKGLEFPVVILYNLEHKISYKSDITFKKEDKNKNYEVDFKYKSDETKDFKEKLEKEKKELILEKIRLLYVAMTRAKDFLVIAGINRNNQFEVLNNKDSMAFYLNKAIEKTQQELVDRKYASIFKFKNSTQDNKEIDLNLENLSINKTEFEKIDEDLLKNQFKKNIESYSSLKSKKINPKELFKFKRKNTTVNFFSRIQNLQAAHFGNICHDVMESITEDKLKNQLSINNFLKEKVPYLFQEYQLIETKDYSIKDAIDICSFAILQPYILQNNKTYIRDWSFFDKEKFFFLTEVSEDIDYFNGYIDGIFLYNEKYYIIDWKTDNLENWKFIEEYTDLQYKIQYIFYCFALLKELTKDKEKPEEIWNKKFGGFIYVYLRKQEEPNYLIKKPSYEDIISYVKNESYR